ncbi:MAG: hypothetical protein KDK25_11055 [Leptospiraceae bacterium]|nr:hypothetical protein [Leptospiraceae bacterium]
MLYFLDGPKKEFSRRLLRRSSLSTPQSKKSKAHPPLSSGIPGPSSRTAFLSFLALLLFSGFSGQAALFAHHPSGFSTPAGRSALPEDRVRFESEYRKAERGNRNTLINRLGLELGFWEGHLSWNVEASHYAFSQKNAKDAALWGRPRTGLRYRPFLWDHWLLVLDADVGFAAGGKSMVDEPFYDSRTGLTFGYLGSEFRLYGRIEGLFPLSSLPAQKVQEFRYPWKPPEDYVNREDYELEKSTSLSLRLSYVIGWFEPFGGIMYRLPYTGVLQEKNQVDPVFFRQWEVGAGIILGDFYVALGYQKPFQKIEDRTLERWAYRQAGISPRPEQIPLLEESFTLSVFFQF